MRVVESVVPEPDEGDEPIEIMQAPAEVNSDVAERLRQMRVYEEAKRLYAAERLREGGYRSIRDRVVGREKALATPPAVPLIGDIFYRDTIALVFGAENTYKSFLMAACSVAIATGTDWGPHRVPEPLPTMYVAAEGGAGVAWRLEAACQALGADPDVFWANSMFMPEPFNVVDDLDVEGLLELVRETGTRFLVVDTKRMVSDGLDENSNTDQVMAYSRLNRIREETGCTIVVVHHANKGGDTPSGGNTWATNPWTVARVKANTKAMTSQITVQKHKDVESQFTHGFQLEARSVDGYSGTVLYARPANVRVDDEDAEDDTSSPETKVGGPAKFAVMCALAEHGPMTTEQLAEILGKSQSTVRGYVTGDRGLATRGLIRRDTRGLYDLTDRGRRAIPTDVPGAYSSLAAQAKKAAS